MGWDKKPHDGGQHVPNYPDDVDYILTSRREDEEAWLRSYYHHIRGPIGFEPTDKLQTLDRTSFESFRDDYHARMPGYLRELEKLYAPPGAHVIRTEHLVEDMTEFLNMVQARLIREIPPQNVTDWAKHGSST